MSELSSSSFLQALGWATINSFWQMALLWCGFLLIKHFFTLTSNQKYWFCINSIFLGFGWFIYSFVNFYGQGFSDNSLFSIAFKKSQSVLPAVLTSASVAYLSLLIFPAYKIINNWRFIQQIKKKGLEKAPFKYRLYIQNISAHLGIKKRVKIYLSKLVTSPVTVGFIKPVILLPVAAFNNLSVSQIEAILLHELSHIRRHDYLMNLIVSVIHVVLYFNPFLKLFIRKIEIERENCCDELVLQFEYDRVSYATALLELEKSSQSNHQLAMAAAGKKHLLNRIEKIVGIAKKPTFNTANFSWAFATVLFLFILNSMFVSTKERTSLPDRNFFSEHYSFFVSEKEENDLIEKPIYAPTLSTEHIASVSVDPETVIDVQPTEEFIDAEPAPSIQNHPDFQYVAYNESEAKLSAEEKEQVTTTVENTKKVLRTQWKEVEKQIADGMTTEEKVLAKQEFLNEVENVDWKKLEQKLKHSYNDVDWQNLNAGLNEVLTEAKIESIEKTYKDLLCELSKVNTCTTGVSSLSIISDVSVEELEKAKKEIQEKLIQVQKLKTRKIIKL